jgi:succinylglutamate desuccinylase
LDGFSSGAQSEVLGRIEFRFKHFARKYRMLPAWLSSADFLAFTLANPEKLPSAIDSFTFSLSNGTDCQIWDTGIICFTPAHVGNNDIVLSCGVHGNETAPIEICAALVQDILLERLTLTERVLFLFGNPPAINAGKRELIDNMNRFFPVPMG